jgi:hypothetical protein
MAKLDQKVDAALRAEGDEVWATLTKRLIAYAVVLIRGRRWRGSHGGVPPDGQTAQSIAADAVAALFGGTDWQPTGNPYSRQELEFELMRIVRNIIRNLERRKENSVVLNEPDLSHKDEDVSNETFFNNVGGNSPRADEEAQRSEAAALLKKFQDEFRVFLGPEDRLRNIFNCVCEGVVKRDEQAKLLSVTPQEITNARKRLDRKLDQFAEDRPNYPLVFIEEMKNA